MQFENCKLFNGRRERAYYALSLKISIIHELYVKRIFYNYTSYLMKKGETMKKHIIYYCWLVMVIVIIAGLTGCSSREEGITYDDSQVESDILQALQADLEQSNNFSDNTVDVYYAKEKTVMKIVEPEGALVGGGNAFLINDGKALYFKKHLFEKFEDCWDEVTYTEGNGQTVSIRLDYKESGIKQVWMIGRAQEPGKYILHSIISNPIDENVWEYKYHFFVVDEEFHEIGKCYDANFLEGEKYYQIIDLFLDKHDMTHAIICEPGTKTYRYVILSPNGELENEYVFGKEEYLPVKLTTLYDGTVAIKVQTLVKDGEQRKSIERCIWTWKENEMESWGRIESGYLDGNRHVFVYDYESYDEEHIAYIDGEGLWICNRGGNEAKCAYEWKKHGISMGNVCAFRVLEEKEIGLIYEENNEIYLLMLMLTKEKKDIPMIRIAVSKDHLMSYRTMVTAFHKKYPAFHVELMSDYDQTALLTELISGNGPELIDTALIDFREHKELWMPLDDMKELHDGELIPNAVELGSIDGTWYGVVTSFLIETVVTANKSVKDWTYDEFMKSIRDNPKLEAIYNVQKDDGGLGLFFWFLSNGVDDNYFFDAKSRMTFFREEGFREALKMADKYCPVGKTVKNEEGLLDGKVLCNVVYLDRPEVIAYYRIRYGEKMQYVGFPTGEGAVHYVRSQEPLALRKTAGEKEKQLALLFMKYVMSEENQLASSKMSDFGLSIRKDVLERQFDAMDETTLIQGRAMEQNVPLGDKLDVAADKNILFALLADAKPRTEFPSELNRIFMEELGTYFMGGIKENDLIEHLENRVGLYLKE